MEVKNLKNNRFGGIDCEYKHPNLGWIPFTATREDSEVLGREIFDKAIKGDFGEIAPLEISTEISELKIDKIKEFNQRTEQELANLDWKVLRHIEQRELQIQTSLTEIEYHELLQNRQTIRDKVNNLETIINATNTIEELTEITW